MKEMSIGDIGVLQNLYGEGVFYNGTPAEIVKYLKVGDIVTTDSGEYFTAINCWWVRLIDGLDMIIELHQIRPLSDPDEHVTEEHEQEVEA